MGDAVFENHVHGRECKLKVVAVEDFDPRPQKYRGTVKEITLEPSDIPGAVLEEPFEAHAIYASVEMVVTL